MRSLLDCESFVCRQNWYDTITHSNRSDFGCIFRLLLLCALHSNCMWLCNWYNSSGIYYIYSRMNFDNGSKRWLMIYECDTFNSYSGSFLSFVWLYLRNLHSPQASIFSHIYSWMFFLLFICRNSTSNVHIHYRRSVWRVKNCCDRHARQREKSPGYPSRCWTRPNCKTISTWIWSIGQHKMCWPSVWAAVCICGVHALVK